MKKILIFLSLSILLLASCKSTKLPEPEQIPEPEESIPEPKPQKLTLLFMGDVMAHAPNYTMGDYDKIWRDTKHITSNADFVFANLEMPVCDSLPYSTYPQFNVHKEYAYAAIRAGVNVFSLANNHTNDQFLDGIKGTREFAAIAEKKSLAETPERPLYFSGLKDMEKNEFSYCLIEKDGWKILYVAITQLLNRPDYSSHINYVRSRKDEKEKFVKWLKELKAQNPCDVLVLSLHTNEDEYIRTVSKTQENWYNQLIDAGVDILWANHAHIIKKQRLISDENGDLTKLVMYGNGNTISGQRTSPNFNLKFTERDDTGDGLFYEVVLQKRLEDEKVIISETKRHFVTTYINTANEYVLKPLDDDFILYLEENRPKWKDYIRARKEICEGIEELHSVQINN